MKLDLCYSDLIKFDTFEERFDYLKQGLMNHVGEATFGEDRYLNQILYRSYEWRKHTRDRIIIRDNSCDLAVPGYDLPDRVYIHHINPLTPEQIENLDPMVFDPENLICCSYRTHLDLHFSNYDRDKYGVQRFKNDTIPWRL